MSSPAVGVNVVRTIPLIVERNCQPMETEEISGYPFDNSDGDFGSQLDDIAKRHPELAEHLGSIRQRTNSRPNTADDYEFGSRFRRPLADRFAGFGFPFDRDEFDPESHARQFYRPREEFYQQRPSHNGSTSTYEEQPAHHHQPEQPKADPDPEPQYQPAPETNSTTNQASGKERSNLQQSNTTDLGQRQEPVNDRNQRSMSAPPADKGQRFTSTATPQQTENMSQPETKSNERIIPIHIEGRDEPVLPKNVPPSYSQPHQTYNQPQTERIFGQRPEHFTQFLHREPRQYTDGWSSFAEEPVRQQRYHPQQHTAPPHYTAAPPKEEIPIPVHRVHQEQQQQQKRTASPQPQQAQTRQETPPPQPKPAPPQQQTKGLSPIEQIQVIQKEVSALMGKVEKFAGKPKDKEYLYLDEMLTRNLLKLDNIDTQGQENIRSARKEAVRCIEKTISVLEAKAAAGVKPKTEDKMEVEEKPQETDLESKDADTKTELTMEAQPIEEQKTEEQQSEAATTEQLTETESGGKPPNETTETMELVPEGLSPATQPESQETPVETELTEEKVKAVEQTQESNQPETCEGQEKNMSVADAVKMFGGNNEEKPEEKSVTSTTEETKEVENDEQTEEKKDKKKGKKKVEKKEK